MGSIKKSKPSERFSVTEAKPRCLRCVIAVSGAAETGHCAPDAHEKAEEIGREIARQGMGLVTGATEVLEPGMQALDALYDGIEFGFSLAENGKLFRIARYQRSVEELNDFSVLAFDFFEEILHTNNTYLYKKD